MIHKNSYILQQVVVSPIVNTNWEREVENGSEAIMQPNKQVWKLMGEDQKNVNTKENV